LTKYQQIYNIGRRETHGDATHIAVRQSKRAHSLDQIWDLVGHLYRIIQEALLFGGVSGSDVYNARFLSPLRTNFVKKKVRGLEKKRRTIRVDNTPGNEANPSETE
jgi:hypothetical protein